MSAVLQPLPLSFRPMSEADVDAVVRIEHAAYPHPWSRGNFVDSLRAGYSCWVAESGRKVVGYSILMVGPGEGHLLNCCVTPELQGRGLGRRIMERLLDSVGDYGVECLYLEVRPSNAKAIALYRDLGFQSVGLRRQYYPAHEGREDALVMMLRL